MRRERERERERGREGERERGGERERRGERERIYISISIYIYIHDIYIIHIYIKAHSDGALGGARGEGLGHVVGARGELLHLEHAHRTVPDDGLCVCVCVYTYVQ